MSNLQNDRIIEKHIRTLIVTFDEWFDINCDEFYESWSEGDYKGAVACHDGDYSYFEGNIDSLYKEIEEEFLSRDTACFDIEELYKNI